MTHETPTPETAPPAAAPDSREAAWQAFVVWTGTPDHKWFNSAYLGYWASRDAFGLELAEKFGVNDRLRLLPRWLQPYVELNGAVIAADFEHSEHFFFADQPDGAGCHVFDAHA